MPEMCIRDSRWLALPIFAVVMWVVYYVSVTTVGTFVTDWTNDVLFGEIIPPAIENLLNAIHCADWLQGLILDGIVAGVGADVYKRQLCFPAAEAAGYEDFMERYKTCKNSFFVAETEDGEIAGFCNGCCADTDYLADALYHDATLHNPCLLYTSGRRQSHHIIIVSLDSFHKLCPKHRLNSVSSSLIRPHRSLPLFLKSKIPVYLLLCHRIKMCIRDRK